MSEPTIAKTGSTKDVTFTWYAKDGKDWKKLNEAPTNAGSYKVVASVAEDNNYNGAATEKEFSISKATNEWTEELSIVGWTYGQEVNKPTATAKYGTVTFSYSDKQDGTYTDKVPTNAGTWYVKAIVTGNENYTGLEKVKKFTIAKAVPNILVLETYIIKQGEALSSVELPSGFTWKDGAQKADELGKHTFKAVYTPTDTANYQSAEVEITVNVVPALTPANQMPTISAEDKTLTVGDSFDALKDVTAYNKEDGDITNQIEVIENTVDTSKAGTYTVSYKVTDKDGASVTKIITVTVKDKEEQPTAPTKPDKGDNNDPDKNNTGSDTDKPDTSVQTEDNTNILLWSMAIIVSLAGVITILLYKRKRSQ